MVRTKADSSGRKAVAAKAPRKALAPSGGAGMMSPRSGGKKDKYSGGNMLNTQPTPEWQKSIKTFFSNTPGTSSEKEKENADPDVEPGSSKDVERTEKEETNEQTSDVEDEEEKMEDEEEEEEKEEEEEEPSAASSKNFKRNKCVSDSDDDD